MQVDVKVSQQLTRGSPHLTLAAHTHTVGVLVGAARAILDHPLHEDHVPRLFGLAMQVAAFCSCEENEQKK